MRAHLTRYQSNPDRTFGFLQLSDGWGCYTLERPWLSNQRNVSCIPDGEYALVKRFSPIVRRTSGGEFHHGYEVTPVPDRRYIMIHVGNWVRDTQGCILVGGEPDKLGGELVLATFEGWKLKAVEIEKTRMGYKHRAKAAATVEEVTQTVIEARSVLDSL